MLAAHMPSHVWEKKKLQVLPVTNPIWIQKKKKENDSQNQSFIWMSIASVHILCILTGNITTKKSNCDDVKAQGKLLRKNSIIFAATKTTYML